MDSGARRTAGQGLLLTSLLLLLSACSGLPFGASSGAYRAEGKASYYGAAHHGKQTASGEAFNQNALTAAHRSLPFGTRVRVTNLNNQRSVVVRINDRGPYSPGRIIDLSRKAAEQLDMLRAGVIPVRLQSLE
jgi:rare lipoprotein A